MCVSAADPWTHHQVIYLPTYPPDVFPSAASGFYLAPPFLLSSSPPHVRGIFFLGGLHNRIQQRKLNPQEPHLKKKETKNCLEGGRKNTNRKKGCVAPLPWKHSRLAAWRCELQLPPPSPLFLPLLSHFPLRLVVLTSRLRCFFAHTCTLLSPTGGRGPPGKGRRGEHPAALRAG